jgi:hypothetical protein
MTPDEEAQFIALWQAGATQAQIAEALGIPHGTVKSRAHTLQQQGKIQPRPRGGLVPVQTPGQTTDTGAAHDPAPLPQGQGGALESVDLGCDPGGDCHARGSTGHLPQPISPGIPLESPERATVIGALEALA